MEPATKSLPCLYSVTPDSGFILDQHPESEKVWIVSACSGHGFQHSAGVGEALAKWVANQTPPLDMSAFALRRFAI
jgi:sarcosine oxidase